MRLISAGSLVRAQSGPLNRSRPSATRDQKPKAFDVGTAWASRSYMLGRYGLGNANMISSIGTRNRGTVTAFEWAVSYAQSPRQITPVFTGRSRFHGPRHACRERGLREPWGGVHDRLRSSKHKHAARLDQHAREWYRC